MPTARVASGSERGASRWQPGAVGYSGLAPHRQAAQDGSISAPLPAWHTDRKFLRNRQQ